MGGAVSSGRDNNELIDNLMGGNYIRTRTVERVFRALDRAEYMTSDSRDQAYKDLAWRNGPLHLSAPCIYSEVMEGLELHPGLSFLNVGSGTGFLSTLVGLIIGSSGISHGIEVHPAVIEYANTRLGQFIENSATLDEFDFCEPKYYRGNGLCMAPLQSPYDRVYCGAGCPEEYQNYFKQLIKVGGVLVMPLNDSLVQVRRVADTEWTSRTLLSVSFATLKLPTREETADPLKLDEQGPVRLQLLARAVVRSAMRGGLLRRHPELREPPPPPAPAKKRCPRRICIPIEDDGDVEGLNALHDLDRTNGATEMNALLSLVLSMGQNRVAGALRFDSLDSPTDTDSEDDDDDDDTPGADTEPTGPSASEDVDEPGEGRSNGDEAGSSGVRAPKGTGNDSSGSHSSKPSNDNPGDGPGPKTSRSCRGLLTLEFHEDGPSSSKTKSRSSTNTSTANDSGADSAGDSGELGGVPAEVEIYLGKEVAGSSLEADMEWEDALEEQEEEDDTKRDYTSDEDSGDGTSFDLKRQKLDSGIGEGTSTSSGESPREAAAERPGTSGPAAARSPTRDQEQLALLDQRLASVIDVSNTFAEPEERQRHIVDRLVNNEDVRGRRRLTRLTRSLRQSSSSTSCSDSAEAGGSCGRGCKRRAPPRSDARRVRLSLVMKRGVKELPLPYALKKYVNLGRCFQF